MEYTSLDEAIEKFDYFSSKWALRGPSIKRARQIYTASLEYAKALKDIEKKEDGVPKNVYNRFMNDIDAVKNYMKRVAHPALRMYSEGLRDLQESVKEVDVYEKKPVITQELEDAIHKFEFASSEFVLRPNLSNAVQIQETVRTYKDALKKIKRNQGHLPQKWVSRYVANVREVKGSIRRAMEKIPQEKRSDVEGYMDLMSLSQDSALKLM